MKRWLSIGFICSYLGILTYGIGCHTMGYGTGAHPLMYFVVWDMFCGWSSYASHTHIIAEGESEEFYELAPAPWGEFIPWGTEGRRHYDSFNNTAGRIATNTLKHTRHEPITRIFVVEECWSKKYDLPDHIWKSRYDEPKQTKKYCRVRLELTPDGQVAAVASAWMEHQYMLAVANNPRLMAEASRGRPMFMMDQLARPGRDRSFSSGFESDSLQKHIGPPLGH